MKLYSSMITLPVTNKGQQREITLKLGLQSTEAYFPYIAYMFFYYYVRSSVQLKIHAANIEASKFVCFLSVLKIIPKDFPNASSMHMLLLQLSYISLFYFRE